MELLFGHINNLAVIQLISNPYLLPFYALHLISDGVYLLIF